MMSFKDIVLHRYFLLFVLWIILASFNINKAFNIDDAFHLEAAEYILDNPDTPMSGLINWGDSPIPMYTHNQPPLFFYLISVSISLFGANEVSLHLIILVFTSLALFLFLKIIRNHNSSNIIMKLK